MANSEGKPSHQEIKQRQQETAAECLGGICLSDHLSDISFTFPNSQTKLPAHKLFLSMRSKVFEAMFYGPLAEQYQTVAIEDIDIATMEMILRFIYKDEAQLDGNNVLACLYASKKYALGGLVGRCSVFLESSITPENVCAIHEQAKFYDITALQTKCFAYMNEYAGDVLNSDGILQLSNTSLQNLLASDNLSTNEHDNFVAAYKWAIHQCKKKNLTPDPGNLRACLGNVLFEIRFPLMSIEDFAAKIVSTGILTKDEMLMLYAYLATDSQPTEAKPGIGGFSCKERVGVSTVWQIANTFHRSKKVDGYHLIVSSSARVKILSLTGSFVQRVTSIEVSTDKHNIMFNRTGGDQIIFREQVICGPHSRSLHLTFHTSEDCDGFRSADRKRIVTTPLYFNTMGDYSKDYRMGVSQRLCTSVCVDSTKAFRNLNVTLSRMPTGLTEIQFRRQ